MYVLRIEHPVPASKAEVFLSALRELWGRVDVMRDPQARVVAIVESGEY